MLLTMYRKDYVGIIRDELRFWPGLGLPSKGLSYHDKINSCQTIYGKERVNVRGTALHYAAKKKRRKKTVKITMYLGLDNKIKLKFTTYFDRYAILNVLNCLTKNCEH